MVTHSTSRREYHPAVSISSWLIFAFAVELVAPQRLHWLWLVAVVFLAQPTIWRRFIRLTWKARWLWIAMIALYGWTVPGVLLVSASWSPTLDGLETGLIRIERLLLMLAVLAKLLSMMKPSQIAAGVYLLAKPFAWLGLDRRALAVRLALVLEQVENLPRAPQWPGKLVLPTLQSDKSGEMRMQIPQVGKHDVALLAGAVLVLGLSLSGMHA